MRVCGTWSILLDVITNLYVYILWPLFLAKFKFLLSYYRALQVYALFL